MVIKEGDYLNIGPNMLWTSNYSTYVGNMISWLSFQNFVRQILTNPSNILSENVFIMSAV